MEDGSSSYLIAIAVLLLVDVIITLGYAALQNARQSDLQELADNGNQSAILALKLVDKKSQLYVTYTMATTLLNFSIALLAALFFIVPAVNADNAYALPIASLIVLLFALLSLLIGNILPESIGSAYAMPFVNLLARPMRWIVVTLSPLTNLLLIFSRILARIFGSDQKVNAVTEEEIMTLVNAGSDIQDDEKQMVLSVLQLDQTLAREMMIPRIDMIALEVNTPITDALETLVTSGYSRIPIYDENVDNIIGVLYAKDILNLLTNGGIDDHRVRELVRTAYFVPETRPADDLLRDMQSRNVHMAIVVDEYGGTSGLVTIENIMEEIVGDIRDEYDTEEEEEYLQNSDDEYIIDAGMDLDDINELLDVHLDTSDSDTLGGYIYQAIGRVPIVGETLETEELTLRIRSLEGRRIRKVLVTLKPRPQDLEGLEFVEEPKQDDDMPDDPQELPDAS